MLGHVRSNSRLLLIYPWLWLRLEKDQLGLSRGWGELCLLLQSGECHIDVWSSVLCGTVGDGRLQDSPSISWPPDNVLDLPLSCEICYCVASVSLTYLIAVHVRAITLLVGSSSTTQCLQELLGHNPGLAELLTG